MFHKIYASPVRPLLRATLKPAVLWLQRSTFYAIWYPRVIAVFRRYGKWGGVKYLAFLIESHFRMKASLRRYQVLSEVEVLLRKKSNTVFVFGSGASLNDISQVEWDRISQHDVIGVNYFPHQRWVDVDFHYLRELHQPNNYKFSRSDILDAAHDFCNLVKDSPHYERAVFFMQEDFFAEMSKAVIGWGRLPESQPIVLYKGFRGAGASERPPERLAEGLPRKAGAIGGGVSIGRILGWKKIVLVGVDMYDSRYFWLPVDAIRGEAVTNSSQEHQTKTNGVIEMMASWHRVLRDDGVELTVYNPKSLLRPHIPQFTWEDD